MVTSNKLHSLKHKSIDKQINAIDVKSDEELLLLSAPSEYDELYRTLNVPSKQQFVNEQLKDSRELKLYQSKFDNLESFKGYHIKKLCNIYDLVILPISRIKGYLNDNSMEAINNFSKKFKDIIISDANLYILTGRECFYNNYIGKEVKTFIIFYKDVSNERGYRKIQENDTITQLYSSGNDFSMIRIFNCLFLTKPYNSRDGGPIIIFNVLLILFLLIPSIILAIIGYFIPSVSIFTIFIVIISLINPMKEYKECWNNLLKYHDKYYE